MSDLHDAVAQIRERAEKATEGPWDFEPDRAMQDGVYPAYVFAEHMAGYPICDVTTTPIPAGDEDATFIAAARTDVPRLVAAIEAVLKEHRPVFAVFNWRDGLRHEDPCEDCHGAKGEHPCGCWSRDEPDYRCYACETAVETKYPAHARWPCPTVRALTDKLTGEDDA